jgi:hypothetical protein
MANSKDFVNVLKMAMDDEGFRGELVKDLESTLKNKDLHANLNVGEIDELKNIFKAGVDPVRMIEDRTLACPYRGYS